MSFTPVELASELCKYIPELEITFNPNPMLQKIGKVPTFVELILFWGNLDGFFPSNHINENKSALGTYWIR